MTLYGPHCEHDECAWSQCDYDEPGVKWGCKEQATCPLCGPSSANWPRIATAWTAWAQERYGVSDSGALADLRVPPNVIEAAVLVEANPPAIAA